jgi:OOP family OmpA-OmpF porin
MKNTTQKLVTTCAAALVVFLAHGSAFAQLAQSAYDIDTFNVSERGSDWFALDSFDLRGDERLAAGVVGEWAFRPLAVNPGTGTATVVTEQFFLHPGVSVVLVDRVRAGIDVPVAVYQSGHMVSAFGQELSGPNKPALGDIRLGADLRIFGQYGEPITVGVGGQVFLPTGQADLYTGDDQAHGILRATVAGMSHSFEYSVQAGAHLRALTGTYANAAIGNELIFAAAAGVSLLDHKLVVGPEFYGSTVIGSGSAAFFGEYTTPLEVILGAHFTIANDFRIGAAGGPGLSKGFGTPVARAILSLEWAPAYHAPPPEDPTKKPPAE